MYSREIENVIFIHFTYLIKVHDQYVPYRLI